MPSLTRLRRAPWLAGAVLLALAAGLVAPVAYALGWRRWPLLAGLAAGLLLLFGGLERLWQRRPLPRRAARPATLRFRVVPGGKGNGHDHDSTGRQRRQAEVVDVTTASAVRTVRAPRGAAISCRSWQQEAALRMLMNNLDPEVAERPQDLVVYGGIGKAARNWECYEAIVRSLRELGNDETLLVQSGKPWGSSGRPDAPRVLISNSMLVPAWATWEHFYELDRKGLMMYGQMTAGSWIYIGTQGILQGTYETFAEAARQRFGGTLKGRLVVTAGLGGMGGAQPLAATMNEGVLIAAEVDRRRIERRLETRYLDVMVESVDEAIARALAAGGEGGPLDRRPRQRGRRAPGDRPARPRARPRHGPDERPRPAERVRAEPDELRAGARPPAEDPSRYMAEARRSMGEHVRAMLDLKARGSVVFDYGNNIRAEAKKAGVEDAFDFPGFVPAYIRPLFCEGKGPFRWACLSGDPDDLAATDEAVLETFPEDRALARWISLARERVKPQGLPVAHLLAGLRRARRRWALVFNELVRSGRVKAPIVIGRDHLDAGSVASPNRETEGMRDGSDAVADWPILNALLNAVSGATWVSVHHGGGVGMGYSIHAGMVVVADGTPEAAPSRARPDDRPGHGRHAPRRRRLRPRPIDVARERGVKVPMLSYTYESRAPPAPKPRPCSSSSPASSASTSTTG